MVIVVLAIRGVKSGRISIRNVQQNPSFDDGEFLAS